LIASPKISKIESTSRAGGPKPEKPKAPRASQGLDRLGELWNQRGVGIEVVGDDVA
jgi:hypothetical protein